MRDGSVRRQTRATLPRSPQWRGSAAGDTVMVGASLIAQPLANPFPMLAWGGKVGDVRRVGKIWQ